MEVSLRLRRIRYSKKVGSVKLSAHLNKKAVHDALHYLVGIMINSDTPVEELCMYTGESSSCVWIGAAVGDSRLAGYYQSDLSCFTADWYPDYNLIGVINTMNNHFGDARFRWQDGNLMEFILVFPKKLKLPWYLKDEVLPGRQRPQMVASNNHHQILKGDTL
jgi:hypothetical protein